MIFLKRRALMTRASFNYKTVNGIESITLENCVETRFKRLELLGNSAQGENPSIESPKEIKNSGKYDEVSGKYVIDVGVTGKNLIDVDELRNENGYLQSNYMKSTKINPFYVEKDKKYLLIAKGKSISNEYSTIYFGGDDLKYTYTNTYVLYSRLREYIFNENKYVKIILTANKTAMITSVMIHGSRLSDNEYEVEKLGLFEMSQVDSVDSIVYEPYHEPQTVRLQLDEPLRGIGEYKDVVTKDGILRKIGHLEIKGGLTWNDYGKQFRIIVSVEKAAILYSKYLCNYTNDVKNFGNQHFLYLYFTKKQIEAIGINTNDTLEVANKKLNEIVVNKPIVIEYPLKTPIFEPFPQETQLALENLHTNDGTTVITVDSGEVETGIEVEYAIKN
ncbi:MAG: hypothetical protein ACLRPZ_04305 [Coprococcus sp.]